MPLLVGFVGFAGAGKDTAANALPYPKLAFADPLKDAAAGLFGMDREMLEGATPQARAERELAHPFWAKKGGFFNSASSTNTESSSGRNALIQLGALVRNHFRPDFFLVMLERRIQTCFETQPVVIVKDCRLPNEIACIKAQGGVLIAIQDADHASIPWLETATRAAKRLAKLGQATRNDLTSEEIQQGVPDPSEFLWLACQDAIDATVVNVKGCKSEFEQTIQELIKALLKERTKTGE